MLIHVSCLTVVSVNMDETDSSAACQRDSLCNHMCGWSSCPLDIACQNVEVSANQGQVRLSQAQLGILSM